MYDTDVLIIGAGPTGLTLALELAVQNISFRIIEKSPTRSDKSRALAVQPRTLELLNRHGDAGNELVRKGFRPAGVTIYVNQKKAGEVDIADAGLSGTAFPQPLILSQVETEQFLEHRLTVYGHEVERPLTAKGFVQDDTGVTVTVEREDSKLTSTIRCRYVVGCDGAHSVVRHSCNMKFEGEAYPHDFILTDVHLDWDGPKERAIGCFGRGTMIMLPLKDGLVRIIASRPGKAEEADPTLEDFQEHFSQMAPGHGRLHDPIWLARFRLHHRGVDRYRNGRLFVAGDAAHVHSPAGGQGMNTGIQDAINLGWKLARVVNSEKPDSFLDTYHDERWPVGQRLLQGTDQLFSIGASANPFVMFLRNTLLPWFLPWYTGSPERRVALFLFVSEFGIHYRKSPIVGTAQGFDGPVLGGDRAPDGKILAEDGQEIWLQSLCQGPRHHLLLFSGVGDEAVGIRELAETVLRENIDIDGTVHYILTDSHGEKSGYTDLDGEVHKLYGFEQPGYVYIRPDGYVEYIGHLDKLGEVLKGATR